MCRQQACRGTHWEPCVSFVLPSLAVRVGVFVCEMGVSFDAARPRFLFDVCVCFLFILLRSLPQYSMLPHLYGTVSCFMVLSRGRPLLIPRFPFAAADRARHRFHQAILKDMVDHLEEHLKP